MPPVEAWAFRVCVTTCEPLHASARKGESVEAWAFRPAKKGREKGGFSPGPSPLNFPGL